MAPLVYARVEVVWCLRLVTDPCTRSAGLPTFEEGACWQLHQEQGEQDHPDADPLADIESQALERIKDRVNELDWDDMQLNVPNPYVPAQFYIANVGGARSSGAAGRPST